jgi:protein-L-isoaspartate O-methyltransferase
MKLSLKQIALIQTAKLFAIALSIVVLTNLAFAYLTVFQIGIGFCIVVLAFLVKTVYDIELYKAKDREALKELNELNKNI